jgi:hypothetical protein
LLPPFDGLCLEFIADLLSSGLFANGTMNRMAEDPETGLRFLKRYRIIWKET